MPATRLSRGMKIECHAFFTLALDVCNQLHTSVHSGYEVWLGCWQLLTLQDSGYDSMDMCYKLPTVVHMPPQDKKFKF